MGNRSLNEIVVHGPVADLAALREAFGVDAHPSGGVLTFWQSGLDDSPAYGVGDQIARTFPQLSLLCFYRPEGINWEVAGIAWWTQGRRQFETQTQLQFLSD